MITVTESCNIELLPILGARMAFFDLDETITSADTDWLWARWRAQRDPAGFGEIISLFFLMRDYKKKQLTIDRYMAYHRRRVRGLTPSLYRELAEKFFYQKGNPAVPLFSEAPL